MVAMRNKQLKVVCYDICGFCCLLPAHVILFYLRALRFLLFAYQQGQMWECPLSVHENSISKYSIPVTSSKIYTVYMKVNTYKAVISPNAGCIFFIVRDASTSLVISRLGSLGVYQKAVCFYCCVVNVSFVKF